MTVFVSGRSVVELSDGRAVVAWDRDGQPMYRDDPPCFLDPFVYQGDEYEESYENCDPREVMW